MSWQIEVFGVRHLSPMGAWHLRAFLDRVRPELVLIEGLDDATDLLPDITRTQTRPPIAILAYTDSVPVRTLVYPFARYSPEYQAILWAHQHRATAEFFDLPSDVFLGLQDAEIAYRLKLLEAENEKAAVDPVGVPERRTSLYEKIAALAGERDYDTYWERHFEHNASEGSYQRATLELGKTIRELEQDEPRWRAENLIREAYMRRRVEQAIAAGHRPDKIVAVVGAFHGPVVCGEFPSLTDDELSQLPRRDSKLTLMPYSYFKLSSQSGYGAGNSAPAYYELLWDTLCDGGIVDLSRHYLSHVARHLRDAGSHRSTAEVIDAVRLAETLSALKQGIAPTLVDLRDAAVTLLGQGEPTAVREALAHVDVGTGIGQLPAGVSQTSIQDDFARELQRLRLEKYRSTVRQELDLDLRENRRVKSIEAAFLDLHRSCFCHRLRLLEVPFVRAEPTRQESATWAEKWSLQWSPECEIALVESVLQGETVELATAYKFKSLLETCTTIDAAAGLVQDAFHCGLMASLEQARDRLQSLSAHSSEFKALATAAWRLSWVIRFGDVRRFDIGPLVPLLQDLFVQSCYALFGSANGDDRAAREVMGSMDELNKVSLELHDRLEESLWIAQLQRLSDADDRHPELSGYACAILLERGLIENEVLAREVSRRISPGVPSDLGAGWFAGLAQRNRYALLARQSLWEQLAAYIASLDDEQFRRAVVFLRRAFGAFSAREKRHICENLGQLWGLNPDMASEMIEQPLSAAEEAQLKDLNEFEFDDL